MRPEDVATQSGPVPAAADTYDEQAGQLLAGKYQVERVLGRGGMGLVVLAEHVELARQVAIKFLLPRVARQKDAVRRFLREAKVAARISSEHAVRVFDVGTVKETGAPYIVMEYLEGTDLLQHLRNEGPLTSSQAVTCILQVCEVLAEAHAAGIVHRDLKPANVFLTRGMRVKVLDFGISKLIKEDPERALTGRGSVMGSPGYMAPEQMRSSSDVDGRTDIWALGAILYQALTGRPPFEAPTLPALFSAILLDEPKPFEPIELFEITRKCLRVSRADRYQDVLDLAEALLPFAPDEARGSVTRIRATLARRFYPARRLWPRVVRWLPIALAIPVGAALALAFESPRPQKLRRGAREVIAEIRSAPLHRPARVTPPPIPRQ